MQASRILQLLLLIMALLFGGAAVAAGYVMVRGFSKSEPQYSLEDLVTVTGRIDRVEGVPGTNEDAILQIRLNGDDLPFRAMGPWPEDDDREVRKELREGGAVSIGMLRSEQANPAKDLANEQEYRGIYTLEVNGRTAVSLSDYNRWAVFTTDFNRTIIATWFLVFFGGFVVLAYCYR